MSFFDVKGNIILYVPQDHDIGWGMSSTIVEDTISCVEKLSSLSENRWMDGCYEG